jgi:CheY-like chemotaxis protein
MHCERREPGGDSQTRWTVSDVLEKAMVTGRLKDRNKMERRLGKIQARHPQVNDLHDLALKMWGYRTLLAYNGKEALEMAEHHRGDIDLLLSDVTMRRWAARNRRRKIGEGLPTSWPQGGKTGQKWGKRVTQISQRKSRGASHFRHICSPNISPRYQSRKKVLLSNYSCDFNYSG